MFCQLLHGESNLCTNKCHSAFRDKLTSDKSHNRDKHLNGTELLSTFLIYMYGGLLNGTDLCIFQPCKIFDSDKVSISWTIMSTESNKNFHAVNKNVVLHYDKLKNPTTILN